MHANRHTMVSNEINLAGCRNRPSAWRHLPACSRECGSRIAEESLIRTQVSNVFNKAGLGHETPVNLVYQLDGDSGVASQPNAINK